MNNGYLIPANSKKSMMYFGLFTLVDIIIFGVGCLMTLLMVFVIKEPGLSKTILILTPALVSAFLVAPVPYYHNVLQLITNIVVFFTHQRKYRWKGWCIYDDTKD